MLNIFKPGDKKHYSVVVKETDTAAFDSGKVHPVYSTFALARDAEWACRLFVLDMKEENEEGIGTYVSVNHLSPAVINSKVDFVAEIKSIEGNSVLCSYEARVGDRLIASGEQGQKIISKNKLETLFASL